jgi:type II secretory pathway pseudopilin PulG
MKIKNLIFVIILLILILLALLTAIFYYNSKSRGVTDSVQINQQKIQEQKTQEMQTAKTVYDTKFPDIIKGTINITSDTKTTIKTAEKEYLIFPARPKSFYKDSGIANGILVQVQGKIAGDNIALGSVVPVAK